ncbi:MAG TPA: hypothetical protein VKW08_19635 [Xanthobacteraceae bacterium]|nr:hypothetical protein [Xanthobacteraceae bacterium]
MNGSLESQIDVSIASNRLADKRGGATEILPALPRAHVAKDQIEQPLLARVSIEKTHASRHPRA